MTSVVRIYKPFAIGTIISEMAYGAIVKYTWAGLDFEELLGNEDYEVLYDLDEVMKELDEKND